MVVPEKAAAKLEHAGKAYYFCSKGCAERFSREPEKFLAAPETAEMDDGSALRGHGAMEHARATASLAPSDGPSLRVIGVDVQQVPVRITRLEPTMAGNLVVGSSFDIVLQALDGPAHGTYFVNYTRN